jgi:DNA-binding transcriptional MerR regulator
MGKYSIKELERLSGIKAHTLRVWEKRYKLFTPSRTDTNIRYYCDEDLRKLLNITLLCNDGTKISKIVSMSEEELFQAVKEIKDDALLNQKRVDDLIIPMMEFDECKFNGLFNRYTTELGLEKTFTEVVFPFLEKVGVLWLCDEIRPYHEHFTSHVIRQKLSAAIDALPDPKEDARKVILFLPEGEYHELGLLFFSFLYKKRGIKVFYFGQSVPIEQVKIASEAIQPNWILSYAIVKPTMGIDELLKQMAELNGGTIFFLENKFQCYSEIKYPQKIHKINHFSEALSSI